MGENESAKQARRPLLVVGLVLIGLLLVAAVLLLVDPFGWRLLDKASGLTDEAAGAMPADVALYAEIDLIDFSEETLTGFSQPFVAAIAEPGVEDLGSAMERLDSRLDEEIGLTLADDVMPWLGRSVGLGLTELALLPDGQIDRASSLLVAGTQDRRAADDFLNKLEQRMTELSGVTPVKTDYQGRSIVAYSPGDQSPFDGLAFSRSAGQVLIGSDEAAVRAGIDAQRGQSLADDEQYRRLVTTLPEERGMTLFADQSRAPEMNRLLASVAPLAIGPLDLTNLIFPPGAVGVSIVDQGLRLDTATPAAAGENLPAPRQMAPQFPATTLAYVSGESLDGVWTSLKDSLAAGGALSDFEESMALLNREFGYDPDQQLLPLLDGEWTLALLPAGEGLVSELSGLPLGLVLLAGSQDAAALAMTVDELTESLAGQRLPLETADIGGVEATTVDLESLIGAPLPLYGMDGDYLFLGSDAPNLVQVLAGEDALGDDAGYQAAAGLLPDEFEAGAYVDVNRLLAQLGDGQDITLSRSTTLLSPVQHIISGTGPAVDGVRPGMVFIVIE